MCSVDGGRCDGTRGGGRDTGRGDCSINYDFSGYHSKVGQSGEASYIVHNSGPPLDPYTAHSPGNLCPAPFFKKKALVTSLLRKPSTENRTAPTGPVGVWGGVRCSWLSNDRIKESRNPRLRIKLRRAETNTRIHASPTGPHNGHNAYFPAYTSGGRAE